MDSMVSGFLLLTLVLVLYFLPGIAASDRRHPSAAGIWLLTLFLGWTFLGWVIALVWAFSAKGRGLKRPFVLLRPLPPVPVQAAPPRSYDVHVAGLSHPAPGFTKPRSDYARQNVRIGDRVQLVAEPDNEYDPDAVKVLHGRRGFHLGYIPEEVRFVKQCLDEGDVLYATVIENGVYMTDENERAWGLTLNVAIWQDGPGVLAKARALNPWRKPK